jgi:hypothetical protein
VPTGGGYAFRGASGLSTVELGGGAQLDAFGRLRTSQPYELFSKACELNDQPLFYQNVLLGGATSSYSSQTTETTLSVAAPGDRAIRQSRWYVRYRPGKSQQVFITGNFEGSRAGVVKRMGLFDDDTQPGSTGDGVFFEVDGTGIFAVLRSSTSGVVVDTRIPQAAWNVDKLDGSGPSGIVLDLTRQQVVVLDFGWLGSAGVRWGFDVGGAVVIVHELFPSNGLSAPFMARPSLPLRWEVVGTAPGSMRATCGSVQSEGGFNTQGVQRAISRGGVGLALTATALRPLLTIRLKDAYRRGLVQLLSFTTLAQGSNPENYEAQLLVNASLVGATFAAGSASEIVEYDVAATAISGGRLLDAGYGVGGGGSTKSGVLGRPINSDVPISSNYFGVQDTLTLAVRPLGTSNTTFFGGLTWTELY